MTDMICEICGRPSGEFNKCEICDTLECREWAIKEEKRIEENGQVPFYRLGDVHKLFPYALMTKEEVDEGFNSLFG